MIFQILSAIFKVLLCGDYLILDFLKESEVEPPYCVNENIHPNQVLQSPIAELYHIYYVRKPCIFIRDIHLYVLRVHWVRRAWTMVRYPMQSKTRSGITPTHSKYKCNHTHRRHTTVAH